MGLGQLTERLLRKLSQALPQACSNFQLSILREMVLVSASKTPILKFDVGLPSRGGISREKPGRTPDVNPSPQRA